VRVLGKELLYVTVHTKAGTPNEAALGVKPVIKEKYPQILLPTTVSPDAPAPAPDPAVIVGGVDAPKFTPDTLAVKIAFDESTFIRAVPAAF
jgi:hypothetical protein